MGHNLYHLYLDRDARWELDVGEGLDDFWVWRDDINEALVGAALELVARVFVDEGATNNRVFTNVGWKWNRTAIRRTKAVEGRDDLLHREI